MEIGAAADKLSGFAAFLFEEDGNCSAQLLRVKGLFLLIEQGLEALQPLGFDVLWHLLGHACAGCSRAARIFEAETACVTHLSDEVHRVFECLIILTRKTDNHVTGNGDIRSCGANVFNLADIVFCRVPTVHGFKNPVIARLHR